MKRAALAMVLTVLCASGCTYAIRAYPPDITQTANPTPGTAVFAMARFEDGHPQKPYVGYAFQHCIMRRVLMIGPVLHQSEIPLQELFPQCLSACMRERGFNTELLDREITPAELAKARPPEGADYLITGTVEQFYFSTPSADLVPADIRIEWTGVVTDRAGRVRLRRQIEIKDRKLFGFGTNGFFNIDPFVRKNVERAVQAFVTSPELVRLVWKDAAPDARGPAP